MLVQKNRVRFYFLSQDRWYDGAEFRQEESASCKHVVSKGRLYVLGETKKPFATAEVLSTSGPLEKESWNYIESMQKVRSNLAAVSCQDAIYALEGFTKKRVIKKCGKMTLKLKNRLM